MPAHHITAADQGKRLDNLVARYLAYPPRSLIYRLIRTGVIRLDKKRTSPSARVATGQVLQVPAQLVPAPAAARTPPAELIDQVNRAIVHSDTHLLVLDKPAGMPAHTGSGHHWGVVELVRVLYGSQRFPELVHRIDRLTSGLLLLAHHPQSLQQLQLIWRYREVAKTYLAVVHRWLSKPASVDLPLAVVNQHAGKRVVVDHQQGKSAGTRLTPLQWFEIAGVPATLVKCTPTTGRMHQIRVHCQSIGHPIVGDPLYQNSIQHRFSRRVIGDTMLLHASALQFDYAGTPYVLRAGGRERLLDQIRSYINCI